MSEEVSAIEDLEVLIRLWFNTHADQVGSTVITVQTELAGNYQLSIEHVKLMTIEDALGEMTDEMAAKKKH